MGPHYRTAYHWQCKICHIIRDTDTDKMPDPMPQPHERTQGLTCRREHQWGEPVEFGYMDY